MTLYELTSDYLSLLELAEDPDTDPQIFQDTMDGIKGAIEDKVDAYAVIIKQLEADAEMLEREYDRLALRKMTCLNNIRKMKAHLTLAMVAIDKRKFKTDKFSFNVQKNPPSVKIDVDESRVPEEYMRIKKEPDKTAIKKAIDSGVKIEFAHIEQSEGVRIR